MPKKVPKSGKKVVAVAATAEVLSSTQIVRYLEIRAESTNTGLVFVGDSTVAAANGYELDAGDRITWSDMSDGGADYIDLADVWLDVSVNTEGVTFFYVTD